MGIDVGMLSQIGCSFTVGIENRTSINDIFYKKDRCGIFILHFSDDSYYIGQSLDIPKAYVRIKREYPDILHISVKITKHENCEAEKIEAVRIIESKYTIRETNQPSIPISWLDFDIIVSPTEQEKWYKSANPIPESKFRTPHNTLRAKYKRCYQDLYDNKFFMDKCLPVMQKYISLCIPEPFKTQIDYWGCTCSPEILTDEYKMVIYSRINVYWQEVFTVGQVLDKKLPFFSWHLSKSSYSALSSREKEEKFGKIYSIEFSDHYYEKGGPDQFKIMVYQTADALALLDNRLFVDSIKQFNLRSMRKGVQANSRNHCMDLADLLMAEQKEIANEDASEQGKEEI